MKVRGYENSELSEGNTMQIAVCIPCLNEEATVGKVIDDFRHELPEAKIYVGDNNSRDRTAEAARSRGAEVLACRRRGKG